MRLAIVVLMKPPIFVRSFSEEEREALEAGLRSKDAFVLRRSQILLASSSRGEESPPKKDRCEFGMRLPDAQERHPRDFDERGLGALLVAGSSRPRRTQAAFDKKSAEQQLREMLHRSPREFARDTSLWTLEMAAQVSFEEGLVRRRVSGETIRATLVRLLGVRWQRAPSAGSPPPIP